MIDFEIRMIEFSMKNSRDNFVIFVNLKCILVKLKKNIPPKPKNIEESDVFLSLIEILFLVQSKYFLRMFISHRNFFLQ